jgi:dipeptidyl aminopeptidase/acylaminoacyl peptidase
MRWVLAICLGILLGVVGTFIVFQRTNAVISPIITAVARPLDRYTIPALQKTVFPSSQIVLDGITATTSAYTARPFHYVSEGKTVTGVAHMPSSPMPHGGYPVIVQFRGYVDPQKYYPGEGTEHSAEVFAANGFISLAPDFLGYGGSDRPSTDVFEERFLTYTAALSLLSSVGTLPMADPTRVGIWGHSNGGHIALAVLEITKKAYPTSVWAPVTKPFPYSILYYTDEADDQGKMLRKELAAFESVYDVHLYSLTEYVGMIEGELQVHQGEADEAVPLKWTDTFVELLKKEHKTVEYFTYPKTDHNLTPSWNTVMVRDIQFYTRTLMASGK